MQGNVTMTPCSGSCGTYSGNNEVWTLKTTGGAAGIGANYTVAIDFTGMTTTVTQTSGCVTSARYVYAAFFPANRKLVQLRQMAQSSTMAT